MKTKIIDGKAIAERIKDQVTSEVLLLNKNKVQNAEVRPNLAVLLIGKNEESELYVNRKLEDAREVGIDTHLYKFCNEDKQEDVIKAIEILNQDLEIDAILVQLPLPKKFDKNKIIEAVDPKKDVDCFHPLNQKRKVDKIIAPVHGAVLEILTEVKYEVKDKNILIISNSEIFGINLKNIFKKEGAVAKGILSDNPNLIEEISQADLIISAVGKAGFIKESALKEAAGVIDIGISRKGKKVRGDFSSIGLRNRISFYTPVPGGVGPITVAILLKNTLELFKLKNKN